jgi:membrane protease YdiL (CAAX protease family)
LRHFGFSAALVVRMPATPFNTFAFVAEIALQVIGLILLWRCVLGKKGRERFRQPAPLPTWSCEVDQFLLIALVIVAGGVLAAFFSGLIVNRFALSSDTKTIINSAAFQLGLLIGPAFVPLKLNHHPLSPTLRPSVALSGLTTFLIALPIVTVVNIAWQALLELCGLPAQQQDLLRMFNEAKQPAVIGVMIALAVLLAPITEELLFRATFFRYLRTRVPRAIALWIPGAIFAALHVNWVTLDGLASFFPLIVLAVIFSIAFERTGEIGTAMLAHSLFNLHTVALLLAGVTQ